MRILPRLFALFGMLLLPIVAALAADPVFTSPEVAADGRVTFRFFAPNAQQVALKGINLTTPLPMTRNAEGVWSVTVGPLPADLHSYTFSVDGATVTDPLNRKMKKWIRSESVVEVPGVPPHFAASQPGPHGIIHRHVVFSATRQRETAFQVYTPPRFDPRARTKYPVIYLLHGSGDDETAWAEVGHAQFIADNLIAKREAVPAIIVMTNGHPVNFPEITPAPDYGARNLAAMQAELLTEILPLVEKTYPIRRDRASRAIVGLSMGGGQSLNIGLKHLDTFGWVGGFSSSAPTENLDTQFSSLAGAAKEKRAKLLPRLLWVACGRDDFLLQRNQTFVGWLEGNQVPHTWQLTDGGHSWANWRGYLAELMPLLFRK